MQATQHETQRQSEKSPGQKKRTSEDLEEQQGASAPASNGVDLRQFPPSHPFLKSISSRQSDIAIMWR